MNFLELLSLVPKSVQVVVASAALGGGAVLGMEWRYVTSSDFRKSYILDLRGEIREIGRDLQNPDISEDAKELLREQLERLIDDLCFETENTDPYCKDRDGRN